MVRWCCYSSAVLKQYHQEDIVKASRRELQYAAEHFGEVHHTTLNPEGPGVVRIHLIPPRVEGNSISASVAIINGQDIIPVNVSWSILLTEMIEEVNRYHGQEIDQSQTDEIMEKTCTAVRRVYPLVSRKRLKKDIFRIMNTLRQVAYGEPTDEEIAYTSLGDYAPFMQSPHRMDLMVSAMTKEGKWNCNQCCVHCYAAGQPSAEEKELSTEEWKRIIDKCREISIPQVTFTGGEPTMRDDLPELIEHAAWFITRLNTNGIKLTPEYCKRLQEVSLDSVQITFYSHDEAIHNRLVGAEKYEQTLAGVKNALAAGLSVSINTPLCEVNRDYVKTLAFLHDLGVIYVTCSGLITTGNAATQESEELQLSHAEIRKILREAVTYCNEHGMEISFTSPGWVDHDFCKELGISTPNCGACLSNMAVTPGGGVVPCQSWLSDAPLGDFLADDWETIWNSEACRKKRTFSAAMRCECPLRTAARKEARDAQE
ncbi:MAG: radical SAM protein [Lachnospiraceae bacterium]|nr:radical SAM protein [Lachnospiraceae bacterium]